MIGYATEPEDNLITEFLPTIASHIHVRVIFVQRILNRVSAGRRRIHIRGYISIAVRRANACPPTVPFTARFPHSMQDLAVR